MPHQDASKHVWLPGLGRLEFGKTGDNLANVIQACVAKAPDVTVLDVCETPLRLCDWYATRRGHSIATCQSDIFDHAPAAPRRS